MEDLVGLLLFGVLIACVVALACAAFLVAATVASVCVFGAAIHAFGVTTYRGLVHRGGVDAASGPAEPSFRAYYRGQVWADLRLGAVAAWTSAARETANIRQLVPVTWSTTQRTVVSAALTVYAFVGLAIGAILAALIGVLPALAIVTFALGAWALGAPLRALERLRRRRSGAHFDCPECHDRFPLPNYVCPNCDARHGELAPGPFGVLRHRCTCGARLPSVQFRGRERLAAECPQGHPLGEGVGSVRTFHVPVAGGPSTGKSTFLAAALIELEEASASGTLATTVQTTSRQAYDRILDGFQQGIRPAKTDGLPPAVVAEIGGRTKSALLYAYDVAGEVYGAEDELRRDPAHGLAEGVVLLVDPFALERVKADRQDDIDQLPELRPSVEPPQRMLERLIGVLEEQGVVLSKLSAAICVAKIDALGVGDAIAAMPGSDDHERTRAWLETQGAGNFVRAAEAAFADVRCHGVSALGRTPGTGAGRFVPSGAVAPLLWLLTRAGIEPAAPGEAQATQSQKIAATEPLDVTPKRPIFMTPLDDLKPLGYVQNFGVGLLATIALILAFAGFGGITRSGSAGNVAQASDAADGGAAIPSTDDPSSEDPSGSSTDDPSSDDPSAADPSDSSTDDSSDSGTPPDTASPSTPRNPNGPAGVLTRHYEGINDGNYGGAFRLMSGSYRSAHPNWTDEPSAARPYVNVVEAGPTKFVGSGVAFVHVKFYGHDRDDTAASDTQCRRFEGEAKMVKDGGSWRYDPSGNHYGEPTILPSSLDVCNP